MNQLNEKTKQTKTSQLNERSGKQTNKQTNKRTNEQTNKQNEPTKRKNQANKN